MERRDRRLMLSDECLGVLSRVLSEAGLGSSSMSALVAHALRVARDADRLGLVSERSANSVLTRHVADSCLFALARRPREGETWVDVGSGAGFPGLVLAAAFPRTSFVLAEPQKRRAGFLQLAAVDLGLSNVRVEARRAEDLAENFDVACTRALSGSSGSGSSDAALGLLSSLVREGGEVVIALGSEAKVLPSVREVRVSSLGVDSPGRFLIMQV